MSARLQLEGLRSNSTDSWRHSSGRGLRGLEWTVCARKVQCQYEGQELDGISRWDAREEGLRPGEGLEAGGGAQAGLAGAASEECGGRHGEGEAERDGGAQELDC